MSKQSDAVKKWRKTTKRKLVASFGGSCGICGYNKCNEALEFHHIDPTIKEFSFGAIRASCISWARIVDELKKCVMLCSNCHKEFHSGYIEQDLIDALPKFNENCDMLVELNDRVNLIYYCGCGTVKQKNAEFCSPQCFSKSRQKLDWSSVDLNELSKTKSNCEIGRLLGVSEATIRKRKI